MTTRLLGTVPASWRLDQLTLFNGFGDCWLERCWFVSVPRLGALPIATEGYRIRGDVTTLLWRADVVGMWRLGTR